MAPIKVGFIGLTSNASTRPRDGARWSANAHLDYLKNNGGKYEIVALLNSSKERAEIARGEYELGDKVKAYGDPEEFAADPNIDLVVTSVRVDRHYPTTKPSIIAKKDVLVEWPLASNLKDAQELLTLAKQGNIKTAIALQALFSPAVEKVKELIDGGKIGRVLSSTFVGNSGFSSGTLSEVFRYFVKREVGGNALTIHFAHTIEYILYVLGDFKTWNSLIAVQRPEVDFLDQDGKTVVEKNVKKETPDQILIQGTTTSGAVLSYHLRDDATFPDTNALEWRIYGEKGEIRLTSSRIFLNIGADDTKILFAAAGSTKAEEVEVRKDEWEHLAFPGRNIARLYEAFADGKRGGVGGYRDFEHAVERHRLIDEIWKSYDQQQRGE